MPARKRSTTKKKPAAKRKATPKKKAPVGLVVQKHGGAIHQGPATNPVPGPGRPRSAFRDQMFGSVEQRAGVLASIADGEPAQRIDVPLALVLPHVRCPKCGGELESAVEEPWLLTIMGSVSASPRDRIAAISKMGDWAGVGVAGIKLEDVKEKLKETIAILREELEAGLLKRVLGRLALVWKS